MNKTKIIKVITPLRKLRQSYIDKQIKIAKEEGYDRLEFVSEDAKKQRWSDFKNLKIEGNASNPKYGKGILTDRG